VLLTLLEKELSDKKKYPESLFVILIKEILDHEAYETIIAKNKNIQRAFGDKMKNMSFHE
jgi:hypothetical protein